MSLFLTEEDLNAALRKIIKNAEKELFIISPYIKLHNRNISILKNKLNNPDLKIVIVFGKNDNIKGKSLGEKDFIFFRKFPNVKILYEKRLHAKVFANEEDVLVTSMNLYDYSLNNNIEIGVLGKASDKNFGKEAMAFCRNLEKHSQIVFHNRPVFEKKKFGLSKQYITFETVIDNSEELFLKKETEKNPSFKKFKVKEKNEEGIKEFGYCIRTGVKIPYNRKKPFSPEAFKSWNKDIDHPENYCHLTGEPSNGQTSFRRPVLQKNWELAMKYEKQLKLNK